MVRFYPVSPDYFENRGGMTRGALRRGIEPSDGDERPTGAPWSMRLMALRYFPDGERRRPDQWRKGNSGQPIEIVGVVRDAKYNNLREEVRQGSWSSGPLWQSPRSFEQSFSVRAATESLSTLAGPRKSAMRRSR